MKRLPYYIYLIAVISELWAISSLNSGTFSYTLDDAYIHLSLAQNIFKGTYGINPGEFSAPSSSALWPFLLAPFSMLGAFRFAPLIINILASLITISLYRRILERSALIKDGLRSDAAISLVVTLLIFSTNLIGLTFTGMEHSMQLLVSIWLLQRVLYFLYWGEFSGAILSAAILGPLLRYENLALSLPLAVLLWFRGRRKEGFLILGGLALALGSFSMFLSINGMGVLPSSVLFKSNVIESGGRFAEITHHLITNIAAPQGILLLLGVALLNLGGAKSDKQLAYWLTAAVLLYLLFGNFGWFHRYEVYLWSVVLLALLFKWRVALSAIFEARSLLYLGLCGSLLSIVFSFNYWGVMLFTPVASNNIYEQHFQLRRFLTQFYRAPVAVNDIGLVSFDNDYYILDLAGLGSPLALKHFLHDTDVGWVDALARKHEVKLAMIYNDSFRAIPEGWREIARLKLSRKAITAWRSEVSIYVLQAEESERVVGLLEAFRQGLPPRVVLTFSSRQESKGTL